MNTIPVEIVGGLKTVLVAADDLRSDQYVLLPEDAADPDVPLYVDVDYDGPVLWRVGGWFVPAGESVQVLLLDAPGQRLLLEADGDTPPLRLVLSGEQHDTWQEQP